MTSWPAGLESLRTSGARVFFAVWGLGLEGECLCPRGVAISGDGRDHRFGMKGDCSSPGKHPVTYRLGAVGSGGEWHGFLSGYRSAVSWEEWMSSSGEGSSARALGGRLAIAVPSDYWVLDVDGPAGWRGLVRLFRSGAVTFDEVLGVARTPRGWHVWLRADCSGWTSGKATAALTATLRAVGGVVGLEVKSGGGYVVARDWVGVRGFADAVAFAASSLRPSLVGAARGLGVSDVDGGGVRLVSGTPPPREELPERAAAANFRENADFAEWGTADYQKYADLSMVKLRLACGGWTEGSRNVRLNAVTWYEGRLAVDAGCGYREVSEMLVAAGVAAGLGLAECRATVRSGLRGLER